MNKRFKVEVKGRNVLIKKLQKEIYGDENEEYFFDEINDAIDKFEELSPCNNDVVYLTDTVKEELIDYKTNDKHKHNVFVSELLLEQLVENYSYTENIISYSHYNEYNEDIDDMGTHYYYMNSDDEESPYVYLGFVDELENFHVDLNLIRD